MKLPDHFGPEVARLGFNFCCRGGFCHRAAEWISHPPWSSVPLPMCGHHSAGESSPREAHPQAEAARAYNLEVYGR